MRRLQRHHRWLNPSLTSEQRLEKLKSNVSHQSQNQPHNHSHNPETLPGSNIVDILPLLNSLPSILKPWERAHRQRFANDWAWTTSRLARVKTEIANGIYRPAFLQNVINDPQNLGFQTEEEAAYLSLQLIIGAADTSRISTWSFLEAMMMFPEVQEKAQREIDKVVGDRVPVWEDGEKIPYMRCLVKEVWRWRPPVAMGHPHITTKEISYGGYRLPKGARIHINSWGIGHDARRHQHPERFWPERFENDHNNVSPHPFPPPIFLTPPSKLTFLSDNAIHQLPQPHKTRPLRLRRRPPYLSRLQRRRTLSVHRHNAYPLGIQY